MIGLSEYGESHQNKTNKIIHWICIPLIFWSIIALLSLIPHSYLDVFNNPSIKWIDTLGDYCYFFWTHFLFKIII